MLHEIAITPGQRGWIAAITVFIFFAICMNIQPHGWLAWYRLWNYGQQTVAIVTRLQPETHRTCFFEYYVSTVKFEGSDEGCEKQKNDRVLITYLPSEPSFATSASPKEEFLFQIFAPIFMAALAGTGVRYRVLWRRNHNKARS